MLKQMGTILLGLAVMFGFVYLFVIGDIIKEFMIIGMGMGLYLYLLPWGVKE